jgi:hypothetical protein
MKIVYILEIEDGKEWTCTPSLANEHRSNYRDSHTMKSGSKLYWCGKRAGCQGWVCHEHIEKHKADHALEALAK